MAEESNDNVNEQPEELAAEDVAGAQETPSADQLDREQAIVEEPVAESEQRAIEVSSAARCSDSATGSSTIACSRSS